MSKTIHLAVVVNDLNINGISTVVYNYCTNMDMSKFKIDILAGEPIDDFYKNEYQKFNIDIIALPERKTSALKYYLSLFKSLNKKYDIVHIHGNSATITIELFLAMLKGIKVRIAHSHNSTCSNMKVHKILYPFFKRLYTHGFACSSLAGNWLFRDEKYYIIPNAFDTKRFQFNNQARLEIRKELNLEDKLVVGHIGRFNNQKNHLFLLEVFESLCKKNDDIVMILVGNGPDFSKIKSVIDSHPFKERIIIYGETSRTEDVYSAMDVFVFPSKFEGLGIVALEAQMSGLPCVVSDVLPQEVVIGDNIVFKNLNDSLESWGDVILDKISDCTCDREKYFTDNNSTISKYDISESVKLVEKLYSDFCVK